MNRVRSHSIEASARQPSPVSPQNAVSLADVNQLGIRILGLKSIPLDKGARLSAFFACAKDLENVAPRFVPLLVGELQAACATLPQEQADRASKALPTSSQGPFR